MNVFRVNGSKSFDYMAQSLFDVMAQCLPTYNHNSNSNSNSNDNNNNSNNNNNMAQRILI